MWFQKHFAILKFNHFFQIKLRTATPFQVSLDNTAGVLAEQRKHMRFFIEIWKSKQWQDQR